MDVDPLEDTVPPRYAVESDEEDEYNPLASASVEDKTELEVKIVGEIPTGKPLVVASEISGRCWARGADLGEQLGGVYVNQICVGLVFSPSWSDSTIIVSEATTCLPIWAMDAYAKRILQDFKPVTISLLDSYPTSAYITSELIPPHAAPARYLSNSKPPSQVISQTQLFSPPNLLTTTSASFLANATVNATALLLPAARIPLPRPRKLEPSRLPTEEDAFLWPPDAMESAHRLLFLINGQTLDADRKWVTKKGTSSYASTKAQRRGDVGEGSMYI
ncbi:hypothetical protein CYLTODRAFT_377937 [Cylindrobasidium torrendii FP15055 ss-10]|uniref:Uncharacterized protein n=1 Tax=Cylindrobasidium torrendii FP15055 ss-10 TaxID=1314674 RepID=A0A0D7B786_9AGAR|nr:hypothetical protein CYLTODRAFT_377937 [Cylindrobasidium torrendii FP15055 ss-10]